MSADESDDNPIYPLPIDQHGDPTTEVLNMAPSNKGYEPLLPLIDKSINLLLVKDGDRDHMNHSDITCEQSMTIVEVLRRCRLYFV